MTIVGYVIILSLMAIGAALADPMTWAKVVLLFRHAMRAMNAGQSFSGKHLRQEL
jgi:hypothetical protein